MRYLAEKGEINSLLFATLFVSCNKVTPVCFFSCFPFRLYEQNLQISNAQVI